VKIVVKLMGEKFLGSLGAAIGLAGFVYAIKIWTWREYSLDKIKLPTAFILLGIFITAIALNKLEKKLRNRKPLTYYLLSLSMPLLMANFSFVFILLGVFSETPRDQLTGLGLILIFPVSWIFLNYFQFKTWITVYKITGIWPFNLLALAIKWGVIASTIGIELKWILFPIRMSTLYVSVLFSLLLFTVMSILQMIAFLKLPGEVQSSEGSAF
jgi:uncharacterized membrane protein